MSEAQKFARQVRSVLPRLKTGTLQFWGEWFGRPHDNIHRAVACDADQDILKLIFNEDEVLSIWNPVGCIADERAFRVDGADRVRWEWFYYGRLKTSENLFFEDFVRTPEGFIVTTNVNWYTPQFDPSLKYPAVQLT